LPLHTKMLPVVSRPSITSQNPAGPPPFTRLSPWWYDHTPRLAASLNRSHPASRAVGRPHFEVFGSELVWPRAKQSIVHSATQDVEQFFLVTAAAELPPHGTRPEFPTRVLDDQDDSGTLRTLDLPDDAADPSWLDQSVQEHADSKWRPVRRDPHAFVLHSSGVHGEHRTGHTYRFLTKNSGSLDQVACVIAVSARPASLRVPHTECP